MRRRSAPGLKNITLSAEPELLLRARERARASKTTLNEEFRNWLRQFTRSTRPVSWYYDFMKQFETVNSGRKFSRQEFYDEGK